MRRSVALAPRDSPGRRRGPRAGTAGPFTRRPPADALRRMRQARGRQFRASPFSIASIASVFSIFSLASASSILSIGSIGSILSIGSAGSILSIGSAGSILCIGSAGGILRIGSRRANSDRQPLPAPVIAPAAEPMEPADAAASQSPAGANI